MSIKQEKPKPTAPGFGRLFILMGFMLVFNESHACFCVTREDSVEKADLIFTGIALNDPYLPYDADCYYALEGLVEFKVDSIIKGKGNEWAASCKRISILQVGSDCAFRFEKDSAYLIFAKYVIDEDTGVSTYPFLTTHHCGGTNPISKERLSSAFKAALIPAPLPTASPDQPFLILFVISLLANVAMAILLIRFVYFPRKKNL